MTRARTWPVVTAGFATMFVSFGTMYSFGVFVNPIEDALSTSRASVSGIGALTTATFLLMGAVAGPLADRFGTRRILVAGAVLLAGGLAAASRATAVWQLYATQGFVTGLGIACNYVATLSAVARHVTAARRPLAIGVVVAGSGVGTLVYAPVAGRLVATTGFRDALVVLAAGGALVVLTASTWLHGRTPDAPVGASVAEAWRTPAFRVIWIAGLFAAFAFLIPVVHIVPFAVSRGFSPLFGSLLIGAIGASSTVGRFALGSLAMRFGHTQAFAAMPLGMGLAFTVWLVAVNGPLLVAFAVLYGAFQGGFVALLPTVAADHFGTARLAGVVGLLNTSAAAGSLAGPPAAGAFYDAFGSYTMPIAAGVVVNLLAFAVLTRLTRPPAPAGASVERVAAPDVAEDA